MATNKDPFVRSTHKDGVPHVMKGLVQAGSDQAIKTGELCAFNKTAGYWTPVDSVSDAMYALAIAKEEQKAADLTRYIDFYSLRPGDHFEFPITAARSLAMGDMFVISDSENLAYAETSWPIAHQVDCGHYPQQNDTTIRNRSYAVVEFALNASAWGLLISGQGLGMKKVVNVTAAQTLYREMDGLILITTPAANTTGHVLPSDARMGCKFTCIAGAAYDVGFDPGAAGAIYVEGAKQTDDREVTVDAIGDGFSVVADGSDDWFAYQITALAADPTGAVDVA